MIMLSLVVVVIFAAVLTLSSIFTTFVLQEQKVFMLSDSLFRARLQHNYGCMSLSIAFSDKLRTFVRSLRTKPKDINTNTNNTNNYGK